MIARRVTRARSVMDTTATAAASAAAAGSERQQQQQQQQQRRRRQQQQQLQRRRSTTTVLQHHHHHHHHQQQQPGAGGMRRAMPVRRSCSAVTDREMTAAVAGEWPQPSRQHPVAKRPSKVYRELCLAWNSRVGSQNTNAPAHRVQALFNDLGLYPTSAQVAEMMQCVMKCANRSSPVYMTFGEFCLLAKNWLKNGLDRGTPRSVEFLRLLEKDLLEKHARPGGVKKNSTTNRRVVLEDAADEHSYDVFLGGSCNPTTWRKDLAVPYLQEAGVTFYNPQVDHWSQDLIEIEHAAKKNATILFFVIDSQTRNVVTDIETANFAGNHTNLVLVIHPQDVVSGSEVAGERISTKEAKDIKEALTVLHKITSNEGVLVFDNIPQALSKIVQILKEKNHQNMDTDEENTVAYRKIRDAFDMFDTNTSGKINIFHVRMAVRLLANQNLSENEVLALRTEPAVDSNGTTAEDSDQVCFTFDQFYAIASKYLPPSEDKHDYRNGYDTGGGRATYRPSGGGGGGGGGRSPPLCSSQECGVVETTRSPKTTDVYLAGDSGDDIRWMEEVAIPMIKNSKLTYHAAARTDLSVLLDARTVLFVIPNDSRSLATMTVAAYCLAKMSDRMVLCVQNLGDDDCVVRGEKLTRTAIDDYNRGRKYLADLAARERVPVIESIADAVELAIKKSL